MGEGEQSPAQLGAFGSAPPAAIAAAHQQWQKPLHLGKLGEEAIAFAALGGKPTRPRFLWGKAQPQLHQRKRGGKAKDAR